MTHVVTQSCILCKNTECVDVCPVDCFRETTVMMVIDPNECIDCSVCIPECPVNAICYEDDVPADQQAMIEFNRSLSAEAPVLTRRHKPLPTSSLFRSVSGKQILLTQNSTHSDVRNAPEVDEKYIRLASEKSLNREDWSGFLSDPDPIVRLGALARDDFKIDQKQLQEGLLDTNEAVRQLYISKGGEQLSTRQIDTVLKDRSISVRRALVDSCADKFSQRQIDVVLNDESVDVRLAMIQSPHFVPTKNQFMRVIESRTLAESDAMLGKMNDVFAAFALDHPSVQVRRAAYAFPKLKLSKSQVKAGLQDPDVSVCKAVIERSDFDPTPEQFEEIVRRTDLTLISAISRKASAVCFKNILEFGDERCCVEVISSVRNDVFTPDFANRCISDRRPSVVKAALRRLDKKITQRQVSISLGSEDVAVRLLAIKNYGMTRLSVSQKRACLSDLSDLVRSTIAGSTAVELSEDQIEQALVDKSLRVRLAVVERSDFRPTALQYTRGASDKSNKLRELITSRFSLVNGRVADNHKRSSVASEKNLQHILNELSQLTTWTARKHQLKSDLQAVLEKMNYKKFRVDGAGAVMTKFGEHQVLDVPLNQRGHMQPMRGKKVHLICLGRGPYATVEFAVKAL